MHVRRVVCLVVLVVLTCVVAVAPATASVVFVKWDSPNNGPGNDWAHGYHTVAAGLNAAAADGQVWVAKGTYVERVTLKVGVAFYGGFAGTEAELSERNWSTNVTILDGNQGGSVVTSPSGATGDTCIDGFTIRNGESTSGGGIYCSSSSPAITNNTITENGGGGIYCSGSSPAITNNTIRGNTPVTGYTGHGIGCYGSSPTIANNTITENSGGGIYCGGSSPVITNNTITGNSAASGYGGGIYCFGSSPAITNNIVAFNFSGIGSTGGTPVLRNNCVYNPDGYNYSGIAAGTGDIEVDPKLCAVGYGEVHIEPDSPCVDSGYDAAVQPGDVDMDRQPRQLDIPDKGAPGVLVDIGADESDETIWTFSPAIVRVSQTGNDSNDGSTWALAKKTVQAGVNAASVSGGEVWVAAGTYNERMTLKLHTYAYGGFVGTESSRNDRNWSANVTILDGGAGGSVVTSTAGGYATTGIDGFTIRNGYASDGGGIYCENSSPVVTHNAITGNSATTFGGGIYCEYGSPVVTNNSIAGNFASNGGCGIYCLYSSPAITNNTITGNNGFSGGGGICCYSSSPAITNNTITGNTAGEGGGICCYSSSPAITDNAIAENTASSGGGIYCSSSSLASFPTIANNTITENSGGGISCSGTSSPAITNNTIAANDGSGISCSGSSSPAITNNTITGNSAGSGGGISCSGSSYFSTITNNTITGNSATSNGGGIYCSFFSTITNNTITGNSASYGGGISYVGSISPPVANNIVAFNSSGVYSPGGTPTLRNNCVYNPGGYNYSGLTPGTGDIEVDPKLCAVEYGQVHIRTDSPCVDAGEDSAVQSGWLDMDGQVRIRGPHVDIGADESDGTVCTVPTVVRVSLSGNDSNDGSSWALAKKTVQAGITAASVTGGEVWVAAGIYSERIALRLHTYVYGGFAGAETARNGRNWSANITILDGGAAGSVVTSAVVGWRTSGIDGFTVRNGTATHGGGIYCLSSSPKISNNTIAANTATSYGGGIYCISTSSPAVTNNAITGNTAKSGGGIYCSTTTPPSSPAITDNAIVANTGTSNGGGIYCSASSYSAAISNNIVAFNSSGIYRAAGTPTLRNNCVHNPGGSNYSGIAAGAGDISLDPLFVNRAGGDLHLSASSPCINAGWNGAQWLPDTDMDNQPRIQGDIVDIGADEYWSTTATISDTRLGPDMVPANIDAAIVSAAFTDFFYIESDNRSSGIRVNKAGHALAPGMRAHVVGTVSTNSNGERGIDATIAERPAPPNDSGTVAPLGIQNRYLGGGDWNYDGLYGTGQQGVANGFGLNNIGLIVNIWGKVTEFEPVVFPNLPTWFRVDDGSRIAVKCIVPGGVSVNQGWQRLTVTGISSCEKSGSDLFRLLRVRTQSDIAEY